LWIEHVRARLFVRLHRSGSAMTNERTVRPLFSEDKDASWNGRV
jgi:hypothetical protein